MGSLRELNSVNPISAVGMTRDGSTGLGLPNFGLSAPVRRRMRENQCMHVTAKADYAVRAIVELAGSSQDAPRKVDEVAQAQSIPVSFLENILTQLRSSGIVRSQRGPEGGYWLAQPPEEVNLAQIIRAVEGPLVGVRGQRPEELQYVGSAESLKQVWIALRANLRKVLEHVTVAQVAAGDLPEEVLALTRHEEAWQTR
jgi:Rrf2 family protein